MEKYEDKSNNDLLADIIKLKAEHSAIKNDILKHLDRLELTEQKFNKINTILESRIKTK